MSNSWYWQTLTLHPPSSLTNHCTFWTGLFSNPPRTVNPVGAEVFSVVCVGVSFSGSAFSSSPCVSSCPTLSVTWVSAGAFTEIQKQIESSQAQTCYAGWIYITEGTSGVIISSTSLVILCYTLLLIISQHICRNQFVIPVCTACQWYNVNILSACVYKNQHIPDWSFFFFFSLALFLPFFLSLRGSSLQSESDAKEGSTSDFLFLCGWGFWLLSLSAFLFFLTSCCSVCSSGGCCLCSVKLCFCFSFAFCCSLASNASDRDFFEALPSSSSPRYLWATWWNTNFTVHVLHTSTAQQQRIIWLYLHFCQKLWLIN